MRKFTYNGEDFFIEDYRVLDKDQNEVNEAQSKELAIFYLKCCDFGDMGKEDVYNAVKFAYYHKDYEDVPKLVRLYFDRDDVEPNEKKIVIPKLAEVYRKLNEPRKAINLFQYVREYHGDYLVSTEFVAEVAHALCDLKKFEEAKAMCEWAYTLRKPNLDVISEVYQRIQKETGEL